MAAEIDPLIRTGAPRIQKVELLIAFVAVHDLVVCHQNMDFVVPVFIHFL